MAEEVFLHKPTRAILDIGYAQTSNSFLTGRGVKVYGVDIVDLPAEGYEKTLKCDLNSEKLPFKDGEIDVVEMGCVLAHVAKPLKALAEINRVLPLGGF